MIILRTKDFSASVKIPKPQGAITEKGADLLKMGQRKRPITPKSGDPPTACPPGFLEVWKRYHSGSTVGKVNRTQSKPQYAKPGSLKKFEMLVRMNQNGVRYRPED